MNSDLGGSVLLFRRKPGPSGPTGAPAAALIELPGLKARKSDKAAKSDAQRFWSHVARAGPRDCWDWQASLAPSTGYGQFSLKRNGRKTMIAAHRFAYELAFGPIPAGLCVLHCCDRKRCCNPGHYYVGSNKQNSEDAKRRGVSTKRKLTDEQVLQVVKLRGILKPEQIAVLFAISHQSIHCIWTGKTYGRLTGIDREKFKQRAGSGGRRRRTAINSIGGAVA